MQGRAAEDLVARWLQGLGFAPLRFPARRRRLGKTPDFRVGSSDGEDFLVEVKTLTSATPRHGAVAFKVARARAQFDAVNHGGRLTNVLALVAAAPLALRAPVADLASASGGPLQAIDLVLGFAADGLAPLLLHAPPTSRHAALTARLRAASGLIGEQA